MRWPQWAGILLIVVLAALFAYLNGAERVSLHLGFASFYRISLPGLVFGSFLLGMVTMFLFGLRHDLRVRRALRDLRTAAAPPPPPPPPPPAPAPWEEDPPSEPSPP